jgi:hypothetical protein
MCKLSRYVPIGTTFIEIKAEYFGERPTCILNECHLLGFFGARGIISNHGLTMYSLRHAFILFSGNLETSLKTEYVVDRPVIKLLECIVKLDTPHFHQP